MDPNNPRVFGQDTATPSRSFEEVRASGRQARDPTYVLPPRAQLFQGGRGHDRSNVPFYFLLTYLDKYMIPDLGKDKYNDLVGLIFLGKGGFGKVHLMKYTYSNQLFAVKMIEPGCLIDETRYTYLRREASAMLTLKDCPFTCKLQDLFQHDNWVYFVLEYACNGTLKYWVNKYEGLNEGHTLIYASEMVLALKYLREKQLVHRDIKASNILINERYHALLSDFGLCKSLAGEEEEEEEKVVGTYCLCPPEILNCQPTTYSNDLWTFGCLIYFMRCNKRPFHRWESKSVPRRTMIQKIIAGEWDRNLMAQENDHFRDIVENLIVQNPTERLGADNIEDLTAHVYFAYSLEQFPGITLPPFIPGYFNPPYIPESIRLLLAQQAAQAPRPISPLSTTYPGEETSLRNHMGMSSISSSTKAAQAPRPISPLSTTSSTTYPSEETSLRNHMGMSSISSSTMNRPVPMMIDNADDHIPPPTIDFASDSNSRVRVEVLPLDQYFASHASSVDVQEPVGGFSLFSNEAHGDEIRIPLSP